MQWHGEYICITGHTKVADRIYIIETEDESHIVYASPLDEYYPLFVNQCLSLFGCEPAKVIRGKIVGREKMLYKLPSAEIQKVSYTIPKREQSKKLIESIQWCIVALLVLQCDLETSTLILIEGECRIIGARKFASSDHLRLMSDIPSRMLRLFPNDNIGTCIRTMMFYKKDFTALLKSIEDVRKTVSKNSMIDMNDKYEKSIIRCIESLL